MHKQCFKHATSMTTMSENKGFFKNRLYVIVYEHVENGGPFKKENLTEQPALVMVASECSWNDLRRHVSP